MSKPSAIVAAMFLALAASATLDARGDQASPSTARASERDGPAYPVSGLRLQVSSNVPDSRILTELPEFQVTLGQVADGFVAPEASATQTQVRLIVAPYSIYYASALSAIAIQLSDYLKSEGFESVIVYPLEQEIDPETGRDLRGVGQLSLNLQVRAQLHKKGWLF